MRRDTFWHDLLRRWPLIILGALLVGWAVRVSPDDVEGWLLLYGIGNLLIGAGLAAVIPYPPKGDDHGRDQ